MPAPSLPPAFEAIFPPWRDDRVVFQDGDLVVVDKPADVSSEASTRSDDVKSRLTRYFERRGEPGYLGWSQHLARDASGLLVWGRTKAANGSLAAQFEERREARATFVAALAGRIPKGSGSLTVRAPRKGAPRDQGALRYRLIKAQEGRALVEFSGDATAAGPLRSELPKMDVRIAGCRLSEGPSAYRLLFHVTELAFQHPRTGQALAFKSSVPSCLEEWVDRGAIGLPVSSAAIEQRMRDALDRRWGIAAEGTTTALRLVNGRGDGLAGVDIDLYGDHLVVSLSSEEAMAGKDRILDAAARLGAAGVYVKMRPKHASVIVDAHREEFAPRAPVRGAPAPEVFTVHEHGLAYRVRLGDGLSTGIFLDQRENRRRVRGLTEGGRVLNLFAYAGAFTVAAIAGGARESLTVDVSEGAIAWAKENLVATGADLGAHRVLAVDALAWLDRMATKEAPFDLVILDPPSFATTKQSRFSAESDYRRLVTLACRVLAPGGHLLACSNHRGVLLAKFRRFVREGVREAGREVVVLQDLPDPVDYPAESGEACHLKSVLVHVGDGPARMASP